MRTTRTIRRLFIKFALIVLGGLLVNSIGPILFANLLQRVANPEQIEVILGTFFPLLGYLIINRCKTHIQAARHEYRGDW